MFVKAQIKPSSVVSQTIDQKQRVVEVLVKAGDQVIKGQILLTLDRSELELQYQQAVKARQDIETSNALEKKKAEEKAAQSASDQKEYENQVSIFSSALGRIITNIGLLGTSSVDTANLQTQLGEIIRNQLVNFDPNAPDVAQQTQALIDAIAAAVNGSANPQNPVIQEQLNKDITLFSQSLPKVIAGLGGGLTTNLVSGISLPTDLTKQLQTLGLSITDPLVQAQTLEKSYKQMLDKSVTALYAQISGLVAEVNTKAGSYIGTSTVQSSNSLDSILNGAISSSALSSLAGSSTTAKPAIVLYDNTAPKAVFLVSQFDSAKIGIGMNVDFIQDNVNTKKSYKGKVIYKSAYVQDSSLATDGVSNLLKSAGIVSSLGTEPQLLIEMSIEGENLTDLTLGFLIDAEINTASARSVTLLPAQAMRRELDKYYVFVVDKDNRLSKKAFTPGIQSDMSVEVLTGLDPQDNVILNPTTTMKDGDKVSLKEVS
jgi:multidrug efflux pump subunit AcrA (membrane-fusion protein)